MTPRRSALFMPAHNERAITKARTLDCDVVILDLEDAVAPDTKQRARNTAKAAVLDGGFDPREIAVRVNGIGTEWHTDDMTTFADSPWMPSWFQKQNHRLISHDLVSAWMP